MQDLSVVGSSIELVASNTLPVGYSFTQYSDDTDPADLPSVQIADFKMGANGDAVSWSVLNPFKVNIALIPHSADDRVMQVLANANRAGRGRRAAKDQITLVITYSDGTVATLSEGRVTDMPPAVSLSSGGKNKTNVYGFAFADVSVV